MGRMFPMKTENDQKLFFQQNYFPKQNDLTDIKKNYKVQVKEMY